MSKQKEEPVKAGPITTGRVNPEEVRAGGGYRPPPGTGVGAKWWCLSISHQSRADCFDPGCLNCRNGQPGQGR